MDNQNSALQDALTAFQQGQQGANQPSQILQRGGATFGSSMPAATPSLNPNGLTSSSDNSQSPLAQALGGQGGMVGNNGQYQPSSPSGGQPQIDPQMIQNLIKANSQPVQYNGFGGIDAASLHQSFQSAMDQLRAQFLKLMNNPMSSQSQQGQQGQPQQ